MCIFRIMFVCHGNICRSPMAEFVFKDIVEKRGMKEKFLISSSATSREEIGNPIHYGTQKKLKEVGIKNFSHNAVQLKKNDYEKYDYFIGMDLQNINNIKNIFDGEPKNKIYRLLDFVEDIKEKDIQDPWYTGDFDKTYQDILTGCDGLLVFLKM